MQIYGPFRVNTTQLNTNNRIQDTSNSDPTSATRRGGPVDELDLSGAATGATPTNRISATDSGEIRVDRVAEIRRAIADGSYDTPEKLDAALDRFLDQWA
ncbi:MAG: flagellar biosynthesis anti-sigma factor FlgM [Planctomycetota bacterium]